MMSTARTSHQDRPQDAALTDRQQGVLRLIVQEYVSSGRPVGSRLLTERYDIGVSPATVRNEMAELEAAGFVSHLHTSGGRIPTEAGYRYFVGRLMGAVELPASDQIMIRHQFRQAETRLEGWPELAATVLAEIAGNVSVVTAPKTAVSRVRHLELISLQPRMALLILVTLESTVRQVMVHLEEDADQEQLTRLSRYLMEHLRGRSGAQVDALAGSMHGLEQTVATLIASVLRSMDAADQTAVRSSGIEKIVGQPDVENVDLQAVISLVQGGGLLAALLPRLSAGPEVQVFIGDEDLPVAMRRFGVIISTYGVEDRVTGVLGVVGPTRMSYWRTISTVQYMARLMTDLMTELFPASE